MKNWLHFVGCYLIDPARSASAIVGALIIVLGFMAIARLNAMLIETMVMHELREQHGQINMLTQTYVPLSVHKEHWAQEDARFKGIETRPDEGK